MTFKRSEKIFLSQFYFQVDDFEIKQINSTRILSKKGNCLNIDKNVILPKTTMIALRDITLKEGHTEFNGIFTLKQYKTARQKNDFGFSLYRNDNFKIVKRENPNGSKTLLFAHSDAVLDIHPSARIPNGASFNCKKIRIGANTKIYLAFKAGCFANGGNISIGNNCRFYFSEIAANVTIGNNVCLYADRVVENSQIESHTNYGINLDPHRTVTSTHAYHDYSSS